MSLINIEYGSLASSDIMNQNFSFLDKKIDDSYESVKGSIASIISNIATMNLKLNSLTDDMSALIKDYTQKQAELKLELTESLNRLSMLPNWNATFAITNLSSYEAIQNGYLLFIVKSDSEGYLKINDRDAVFAQVPGNLNILPIKNDDVISSNLEFDLCRFLPATQVSLN